MDDVEVLQLSADCDLDEEESAVVAALRSSGLSWALKREVKAAVHAQGLGSEEIIDGFQAVADGAGATLRLTSAAHDAVERARAVRAVPEALARLGISPAAEALDSVRAARQQWEESIAEELNSMAAEQRRPLARLRRRGAPAGDEGTPRFLYDAEDLLEAVIATGSPNHSSTASRVRPCGLVQVQVRVPSHAELRSALSGLRPRAPGDSGARSGGGGGSPSPALLPAETGEDGDAATATAAEAAAALRGGSRAAVAAVAAAGCPAAERLALWSALACGGVTAARRAYFSRLRAEADRWDLLVDGLFRLDADSAASTDAFFPFSELLAGVLTAFARDPWVAAHAAAATPRRPAAVGVTAAGASVGAVPPCGVAPYRGLALYAAPLCYLASEEEAVYFLFRAMYARLWCRLNVLSAAPGGLLYQCRLFEQLACERSAAAFHHATHLGAHPLRIAFPWIHSAFAAYLPLDQTLLLWDRVLALDALDVLPVAAAAIFHFRAAAVLACVDAAEVREVFSDPSVLRVVPLIQAFLFLPPAAHTM